MDEKQTTQPGKLYSILCKLSIWTKMYLYMLATYGMFLMMAGWVLSVHFLRDYINVFPQSSHLVHYVGMGTTFGFAGLLPVILISVIQQRVIGKKAKSISDRRSLHRFFHIHYATLDIPRAIFRFGDTEPFMGNTYLIKSMDHGIKPQRLTIKPIATPFEPLLLSGRNLQDRISSIEGTTSAPNIAQPSDRESNKQVPTVRIDTTIIKILSVIFFLLFGILPLICHLYIPRWDAGPITWFIPVAMITPWLLRIFMVQKKVFLIPGGILVRKAKFLQKNWTLQRFDRRECVAFIISSNNIRIMNPLTREQTKIAIPREARDLFLSAWLSPLPTPTLEDMSDFT